VLTIGMCTCDCSIRVNAVLEFIEFATKHTKGCGHNAANKSRLSIVLDCYLSGVQYLYSSANALNNV